LCCAKINGPIYSIFPKTIAMKETILYSVDKPKNCIDFQQSIRFSLDERRLIYDWHAYRGENKVIRILSGNVLALIVHLNDWDNPAHNLQVKEHFLSAEDGEVATIVLKSGYAVNFKALIPGSEIEITPEETTEETIAEKFTYTKNRWYFASFF